VSQISVFPDVEIMLLYVLVPLNPSMRIVTSLPAGDPNKTTVRIKRTSGSNSNIGIDSAIVDVDVWGLKSQTGNVSVAARTIQSQLLSLMSAVVKDANQNVVGVIQHVTCSTGPRQLPEVNTNYVRFSASYTLRVHS
jgi:hypothetical protein